jgi:hypothetical protein
MIEQLIKLKGSKINVAIYPVVPVPYTLAERFMKF